MLERRCCAIFSVVKFMMALNVFTKAEYLANLIYLFTRFIYIEYNKVYTTIATNTHTHVFVFVYAVVSLGVGERHSVTWNTPPLNSFRLNYSDSKVLLTYNDHARKSYIFRRNFFVVKLWHVLVQFYTRALVIAWVCVYILWWIHVLSKCVHFMLIVYFQCEILRILRGNKSLLCIVGATRRV